MYFLAHSGTENTQGSIKEWGDLVQKPVTRSNSVSVFTEKGWKSLSRVLLFVNRPEFWRPEYWSG